MKKNCLGVCVFVCMGWKECRF